MRAQRFGMSDQGLGIRLNQIQVAPRVFDDEGVGGAARAFEVDGGNRLVAELDARADLFRDAGRERDPVPGRDSAVRAAAAALAHAREWPAAPHIAPPLAGP